VIIGGNSQNLSAKRHSNCSISREPDMNRQIATFAGGCFWCLETAYNKLEGVERAISGYMGGALRNPTYKQICGGDSGHAEVVQIHFDADRISYRELLEIFFTLHDPTTLNRQGNDTGTQYRSAIFWHSPEQKAQAQALLAELAEARAFDRPIVTELTEADVFWPAEDYHQRYYEQNPRQPYCMFVVAPKLEKFRARFATRLKAED
jgi:peptide-methionine (S)-S-oxide reductase